LADIKKEKKSLQLRRDGLLCPHSITTEIKLSHTKLMTLRITAA